MAEPEEDRQDRDGERGEEVEHARIQERDRQHAERPRGIGFEPPVEFLALARQPVRGEDRRQRAHPVGELGREPPERRFLNGGPLADHPTNEDEEDDHHRAREKERERGLPRDQGDGRRGRQGAEPRHPPRCRMADDEAGERARMALHPRDQRPPRQRGGGAGRHSGEPPLGGIDEPLGNGRLQPGCASLGASAEPRRRTDAGRGKPESRRIELPRLDQRAGEPGQPGGAEKRRGATQDHERVEASHAPSRRIAGEGERGGFGRRCVRTGAGHASAGHAALCGAR